MSVKAGDKVVFGRKQGEKTRGTVIRVSRSSVTVRQDESRGAMGSHPVGSIWRVHPSFVEKVGSSSRAVSKPVKRAASVARGAASKVAKAPRTAQLRVGSKVMSASPVTGQSRTYDVALGAHVLRVGPVDNALDAVAEALNVLSASADTYAAASGKADALRLWMAGEFPVAKKYQRTPFVRDTMKWAYDHRDEIDDLAAEVENMLEELEG